MEKKWIDFYMREAESIASLSKDPKTKCGSVIVGKNNDLISKGFNGYPIHWSDLPMRSIELRRSYQAGIIHAEINALIFADRYRLQESNMFVTKTPCPHCAAVISQFKAIYGGPVKIYSPRPSVDSQWLKDIGFVENSLSLSKIKLEFV